MCPWILEMSNPQVSSGLQTPPQLSSAHPSIRDHRYQLEQHSVVYLHCLQHLVPEEARSLHLQQLLELLTTCSVVPPAPPLVWCLLTSGLNMCFSDTSTSASSVQLAR